MGQPITIDMYLQAFVEVSHASDRNANRNETEKYGHNVEKCQSLSGRQIIDLV
jgi:hypothetical protein